MSTFLRLLHVIFWTWPLQRWCTVLGLAVCAGLAGQLLAPTERGLQLVLWGQLIGFALPALLGGALWRALSAPRAVGLVSGGRARLLFAAWGVTVAVALASVSCMFLFYSGLPMPYRLLLADALGWFVSAFAAATWWAIASFIVSRSPLAMLIVFSVVIASVNVLRLPGVADTAFLWKQHWGIAVPLAAWAIFGTWYLRSRCIAPPGWLLPGGQSIFATVAGADAATTALPRATALERLLLGGASLPRILGQWLLAGTLLLVLQLVLARVGNYSDPQVVAHVLFVSLLFGPVIVGLQSIAVVRRTRALWLPSGYSRRQLFACTERVLLKFAFGMALVFTAFLLVLWYTQPWHPAMTLPQALAVIVLPVLLVAVHALSRPKGWAFYWRMPIVMGLCWFIAYRPLTWDNPANPISWPWLLAAILVIVALRELARLRWLAEDLPRAVTSP